MTPAQIAQYREDVESQLSCYLPLRPPLASGSVDGGLGFAGTPSQQLFLDSPTSVVRSGAGLIDQAMTNVPQHWSPSRRTELVPTEAGQGPRATRLQLSSMEGMTSEGGGHGASLDVDHLGHGSSSQAMDCHNSQRYGSGLPIRVLDYPSKEEKASDPMAEEDIIALADSNYFPDVVLESSGTRRARPASNTRRRVRRTGFGSNSMSRIHLPTGDVIIDVSDSDFQDCSSLRTFNARHSQVTDSTEEQEMLRLDVEWLRVSQAYDVLRRTEDVDALDDRDVHAEAYGNAGRKSSSRFWTTLKSIRQTSMDDNDIAAWDMVLARRSNRRGISEKMVSDELMTVMSHPDMQMWTLSQVESIFLEQAHPDWARWDLLETVCTNAVS